MVHTVTPVNVVYIAAGEARMLGLVMIPGRHITSVQVDTSDCEIEKLLSDHDKVK